MGGYTTISVKHLSLAGIAVELYPESESISASSSIIEAAQELSSSLTILKLVANCPGRLWREQFDQFYYERDSRHSIKSSLGLP